MSNYIPATDIESALSLTALFVQSNIPVFIWGKPGLGKSQGVQAMQDNPDLIDYFKGNGFPKAKTVMIHDWRANLRDPVDARGLPCPDLVTNTTKWLRPSDLPFVGNDNFPEFGILFLEELNTASLAMQTVGFQLVLDRCIGEHVLKPGWRIVACGNSQSDRGTAQRMSTPLANRFAHIKCEVSAPAFWKWAARNNVHPAVLAFTRFRADLLHVMPGETVEGATIPVDSPAFPTPRAYDSVSKLLTTLESMPNGDKIRSVAIASLIGNGPAAEFEGFYHMFKTAPSLADIIANPTGVIVPSEPSVLYAVTSGLARKTNAQNFAAVLQYGDRCGAAWSARLVSDATNRDEGLKQTKAYVNWSLTNQDLAA